MFKGSNDLCVTVSMKNTKMIEISIFGYIANIYDVKERLTDSWDYQF